MSTRQGHSKNRARQLIVGSLLLATVWCVRTIFAQYPSGPQIFKDGSTVLLEDYATVPMSSVTTGAYPSPPNFAGQLARVNFMRSEPSSVPSAASRFFVSDSNRYLYILNKTTKAFTSYLNFEEIFPKFDNTPGLSAGLVTFAFAPDYAASGMFYTVHLEDPNKSGSAEPTNAKLLGLDLSLPYTTTSPLNPPAGTVVRHAVLVEWRDTNIVDTTFQGTAREVLRVGFAGNIHPLGDLMFNPLAFPGHADYGNLYIAVGDGAAGETAGSTHTIPQRLDALPGKILRITPSLVRQGDQLSANGRYRIPANPADPNPFVSLSLTNLKKEIYAYGFRNPHRMSWDTVMNKLIVNDIGYNSWEEVNIVVKGGNFGYAEREGPEQLFIGGTKHALTGSQTSPITPFPSPDTLTVTGLGAVTPIYPAMSYTHQEGDAMSTGFVYRGQISPLIGMYVFGDITTGRLFYSSLASMLASTRTSPAPIREVQVVYNSRYDNLGARNRRVYDIVADEYKARGGDSNPLFTQGVLPGRETVVGGFTGNTFIQGRLDIEGVRYGGGRADIRLVDGGDGEIYLLSKSDGMIRAVLPAVNLPGPPPVIPPAAPTGLTASAGNAQVVLTWAAVSGATSYNVKRATVSGGPLTSIATNVTNPTFTNTGLTNGTTYYYVVSAVKSGMEGVNSSEAFATPTAPTGPLPSPWLTSDIGAVAAAGSAAWANDIFSLTGSGEDIYGAYDEFRFAYQTCSGNCEIIARVFSVQNTDPWAEAGVMIRETLSSTSKKVAAHITFNQGVTFQRRSSTGGQTYYSRTAGPVAPYWVRLVRSGSTFTGYRSANGADWTSMGSVTVTMGTNVYIGLAVTAHYDGRLNTAIIDKVTVVP